MAASWDIFCKVIDNHGDIGVCWRLSRQLAARGHSVRLWVDDPSALVWMAPDGAAGVQVVTWTAAATSVAEPGDVIIEAFGCNLDDAFVAAMKAQAESPESTGAPVWLNLEYLSAEDWVKRNHGLRSPVMSGPGAGLEKFFFYPGFTSATGGLLREDDLLDRQEKFDRAAWLRDQGVAWQGERVVSLFCYEPRSLKELLAHLGNARGSDDEATILLVTAGRAAAAVQQAIATNPPPSSMQIHWLDALPQPAYDELLWASDLNFVRGEDSLVRALWSRRPFVWQIYPQHDNAHHDKLTAFLDWMGAGQSLRNFSRVWNSLDDSPLPPVNVEAWSHDCAVAREHALAQDDLCTQLESFVLQQSR